MIRHYLDWLAETIRENWDKPALTDYSVLTDKSGNDYTYGDLYRKITWLDNILSRAGLQPSDHIAICGANSANWVVSYFAVATHRSVSVTILHTQTPDVIARQFEFADCKALFVDPEIWKTCADCIPSAAEPVFSLDDFSILKGNALPVYDGDLPSDSGLPRPCRENVRFNVGPLTELAQICFSSGSTNESKAVMLSFKNLSNNMKNAYDIFPRCYSDSNIAILPLSHTYGLLGGVLCQIPGAHHLFFLGPLLSSEILIRALTSINPYSIVVVPAVIESLYKRFGDRIKRILGTNLQQLVIGGAAMNSGIEDKILALDIPLTVGYGMTETGPLIGANLWSNYVPHSCGRVVSGMEARISEAGEILVRGDNVMLGYYKDPDATRKKIDAEGWLHTGDRGRIDEDNNIYVYGRMEQDMIVLPSGENVVPQNIEALLDKLDGVKESLVLERNGHLVALVYPDGESTDKLTVLRAVNRLLPTFSQLADIEFVAEPFQKTSKTAIKRYLYK